MHGFLGINAPAQGPCMELNSVFKITAWNAVQIELSTLSQGKDAGAAVYACKKRAKKFRQWRELSMT